MPTVPQLDLADGHRLPQVGLGVYKVPEDDTERVVLEALGAGYRLIDTARMYGNERGVGAAVRASGLPRGEVFVTTKVRNEDHGYDAARRAIDASLHDLGLSGVDLLLIHWPIPSRGLYTDTWRALVDARADGQAASIGVSNFSPAHIDRIVGETGVVPVVDQVELHPWLPQGDLRRYAADAGIVTQSWSPLARGRIIGSELLASIGVKHDATPAQVVLRWHVQNGLAVIPKTVDPGRLRENLDVFRFELDDTDLAALATLETGERTGRNPDDD